MGKIVLLLAAILMVQPLRAQSLDDVPNAADRAGDVSYAPVNVFTNGPGRIYIFERGKTVVDGQMLPVGRRYLLVAVPDPGYEFVNWYPVHVYTLTIVTYGPDGKPNPPTISIAESPVPQQSVNRRVLNSEVQSITVIYDGTNETLAEGFGWQANFEPVPTLRHRSHLEREHEQDNRP